MLTMTPKLVLFVPLGSCNVMTFPVRLHEIVAPANVLQLADGVTSDGKMTSRYEPLLTADG